VGGGDRNYKNREGISSHFIQNTNFLFILIQTFNPESPFTKLVVDLKGIDPDDAFSGNHYFQHTFEI